MKKVVTVGSIVTKVITVYQISRQKLKKSVPYLLYLHQINIELTFAFADMHRTINCLSIK